MLNFETEDEFDKVSITKGSKVNWGKYLKVVIKEYSQLKAYN